MINQFGIGLPWETIKIYVNGTRQFIPQAVYHNGTVLQVTAFDYFDKVLFNQTYTINSDNYEITIQVRLFTMILKNDGDYPSMVKIWRDGELGYNFTIIPSSERELTLIEGIYQYQIQYNKKTWVQEGNEWHLTNLDTGLTTSQKKSFRVSAVMPSMVDVSTPNFPTLQKATSGLCSLPISFISGNGMLSAV